MQIENKLISVQEKMQSSGEVSGEGSSNPAPGDNMQELIRKTPWTIPLKPTDIGDNDALVFLLQGSPKLRALLPHIRTEIFDYNEKSLIWCVNPAQQFFVAAALSLAHIDVHVYHADLSMQERQSLLHNFTSMTDSCMVLVCSYYVNSAGSNLQAMC